MDEFETGPRATDYIKALPQYLLPGHLLSRGIFGLTRVRSRAVKEALIRGFLKLYPTIDMGEAEQPDPLAFEHFNAFFTRALKPGARAVVTGPGELACPVDGNTSQAGPIRAGRIFQAKGRDYSLEQLLGGSPERAEPFMGGQFATIYLAPYNYHRIHMPLDGQLREMVHVPGRLFSVNAATARAVPGLFARNERVISIFDTEAGPMAIVKVAAIFVSGIETVWSGLVTPPAGKVVRQWRYREDGPELKRGEELGRFNMGSTVIVLFGPDAVQWDASVVRDTPVRMGQLLGRVTAG